jgi:hypothetical protein
VTYSDELKFLAVGVPHDVLAAHGAVSAQVAMAMADRWPAADGRRPRGGRDRHRGSGWRQPVEAGRSHVHRRRRRRRVAVEAPCAGAATEARTRSPSAAAALDLLLERIDAAEAAPLGRAGG